MLPARDRIDEACCAYHPSVSRRLTGRSRCDHDDDGDDDDDVRYVRASNLWDEITSYYRRKTLSHMSRQLHRSGHAEGEEGAAGARGGATNRPPADEEGNQQ
jgi:hypothetical protein